MQERSWNRFEEGAYRLKTDAITAEIQRQELKRYWVAEAAGVHKTTLRRWLSGKIQTVRAEHVGKLAGVLATAPAAIAEPCGWAGRRSRARPREAAWGPRACLPAGTTS